MEEFRVGFSAAFMRPDGTSAYPDVDLTPLTSDTRIEVVFLKNQGEIRTGDVAAIDALVLLGEPFTARSLDPAGRLAIVSRFGVGYDKVDVKACTRQGVGVSITPDAVRRPVAVAVLTYILALTGKLLIKDRLVRQGPAEFNRRSLHMGFVLVGRMLGGIGLGNIGAEVFRLARPLDMRFIAHDPYARPEAAAELGVELVDVETVFRQSDILTVNCPLTPETQGFVNEERLSLMKSTAFLINTSRGAVVDQKAIVAALRAGRLAGAGLDVFEK
jgi:phosphoglycerate dehydrogenase-like enzyme